MPIALRLYFKHIFFVHRHKIPKKGPVILASMHPNSFIDDFVIGIFAGRKLRFLARGDVFATKLARVLLESMRVSPVYRAMDNTQDVKKNLEAFDIYTQTLKYNGTLLIHSEGVCVVEKRVRKLKKGTARIAFKAEEENDFKLGVQIVPISLNYTNGPKIRETLMAQCADPILVSDYKDIYLENPAKAAKALNDDLYAALNEGAVVIESKECETTVEQCFEIARNNKLVGALPIANANPVPFQIENKISSHINQLFSDSKEQYKELKEKAQVYFDLLGKYRITDREVACDKTSYYLKALLLVVVLPIFSLGYLANVLPVYLGRKVADKVVKTREFYGSVYVGANWLFVQLYYLVLFILGGVFAGLMGLLLVLSIAVIGFWSVLLRDQYLLFFERFRFNKFKSKHTADYKQAKLYRDELSKLLG